MINGLLDRVRVTNSVKPIHFTKRKPPVLVEGGDYFVSFGNNDTYPCKLIRVVKEYGHDEVEIEIPMKPISKKGFVDVDGKISHHWVSNHILRADEIGLTREEAVVNEMTW